MNGFVFGINGVVDNRFKPNQKKQKCAKINYENRSKACAEIDPNQLTNNNL